MIAVPPVDPAPACLAVLRDLCLALADGQVNWVLTGSLAFALQGLPVEPRDVDVQTDQVGALACRLQRPGHGRWKRVA